MSESKNSLHDAFAQMGMAMLADLWDAQDQAKWFELLERYWLYIKPSNFELEQEMEVLDPSCIQRFDAQDWYDFLYIKYFKWKYTSQNRYSTTTKQLRKYLENGNLADLTKMKHDLFTLDHNNIPRSLKKVMEIRGLGVAGASGLLAILFPDKYGTVDTLLVKALCEVESLEEIDLIQQMENKDALSINDANLLIRLMRDKANQLNYRFSTDYWTPRRIDKVLWTAGHRKNRKC